MMSTCTSRESSSAHWPADARTPFAAALLQLVSQGILPQTSQRSGAPASQPARGLSLPPLVLRSSSAGGAQVVNLLYGCSSSCGPRLSRHCSNVPLEEREHGSGGWNGSGSGTSSGAVSAETSSQHLAGQELEVWDRVVDDRSKVGTAASTSLDALCACGCQSGGCTTNRSLNSAHHVSPSVLSLSLHLMGTTC